MSAPIYVKSRSRSRTEIGRVMQSTHQNRRAGSSLHSPLGPASLRCPEASQIRQTLPMPSSADGNFYDTGLRVTTTQHLGTVTYGIDFEKDQEL
jgi:hypothetical protein